MDWTMPDRPRRLVTYGKLAHNRTERKPRLHTTQAQEEKHSNGRDRLPSLHESAEETATDRRTFVEPHGSASPSQRSRPSNRSPKRRKLSPKGDDEVSPISSPRPRTRRAAATQTTYGRKDSLRRSFSDIPDAKGRSNTRLSRSPDRFSDHAVSSNSRITPPRHTEAASHAAATPSRRRLVDSLRALDDQADSSHSDLDSPQRLSDTGVSRESTPIHTGYGDSQARDSQKESQLRQMAHEVADNAASPMSASPKITYSRQRSFLRNIDLQSDPSGDATADLYSLPIQSSTLDTTITEADQTENSRTVRSIHELRRAGVNARFQGLVDSIFEDIEDRSSSASTRRSGFVQLCEKFLDETFTQRFVETGAFERLTKCMPARGDLITILLSVYACALVLRLSHLPPTVYTGVWPKLIASALTLLPLDDSTPKLITQRRHALSRINQAAIRDISLQFGRLSNLDEQESLRLSPRRLVLRSLHSTMRKVREKDIAETIPVEVITKLVDILLELAQQVTEHDISPDNFVVFESIISILETYTTSSDITGKAQQDVLMPLTNSSHLLSSLGKRSDPQDIQLLTLHLRLILNITNASPSLCENFATVELIHGLMMIVLSNYSMASDEFIDEKKDSLDTIILALGALINLTEVSEAARQNILNQKQGPESPLEQVISIFTSGLNTVSEADSVVQTHSNVAFGYLSILLCTLCIEREGYGVVKAALNGVGIERLLATVEEFLHYHRKVDEELHQSQSLKEFTSRLQRILNQVRAVDRA